MGVSWAIRESSPIHNVLAECCAISSDQLKRRTDNLGQRAQPELEAFDWVRTRIQG
jgi:hypothetical protein